MRIKRLTYFDCGKIKRLVSYLCNEENDIAVRSLYEVPLGFINAILPLSLKFKSESFIMIENGEILGLITAAKTPGNPYKINITRLIFKDNLYEIGKQLVEFAIQKFGGKGATSFTVTVDECHDELFDLFVNGCGFRQCTSETLWKIEKPIPERSDIKWRYSQNSDAGKIAQLYNSELLPICKPSLEKNPAEFKDGLFQGFNDFYKTGYVTEEDDKILGYFSSTTSDNLNYILDVTINSGYGFDYDQILNVMLCEIAEKKRAFYPFVKQKKYTKNADSFGQYLKDKGYLPVQTRRILVKDYYKPIKETDNVWQVFSFAETQITSNPCTDGFCTDTKANCQKNT